MMMKERKEEEKMWVLVDTSLSTHIAMPVSSHMTAADLKRELGKEHFICFPSIGVIKINGFMVKRRSCYYHLPDSILVKDVFLGWKGTWYLHANAAPSNRFDKHEQSESLAAEFRENANSDSDVTDFRKPEDHVTCESKLNEEDKVREMKTEECILSEGVPEKNGTDCKSRKKNKKRNKEKHSHTEVVDRMNELFLHMHGEAQDICSQEQSFHCDIRKGAYQGEGSTSPPTVETASVSVSEVASVTGLITRYFPEFDEVKSFNSPASCVVSDESQGFLPKRLNGQPNEHKSDVAIHNTPHCTTRTPQKIISFPTPAEQSRRTCGRKMKRSEVGKRILVAAAANDLRNSASRKNSAIAICQAVGGRKLGCSLDKTIVFEISDSAD